MADDPLEDLTEDEKQALAELAQDYQDSKLGRRRVLERVGFAGLGALLGGGGAAAIAQPASADAAGADVGTQADPYNDAFSHSFQAGDGTQLADWDSGYNTHAATKSTAYSTDGEHYIDVDTSSAGVTITLSTADTVLGHYKVIRQNGSNDVTIDTEGGQNIDGSSSLTLSKDKALVILWSDGSNWFSNQFIDTLEARQVTTGEETIDGVEASGTHAAITYALSNAGADLVEAVQDATTVGTSATTIYNNPSGASSAVFVFGESGSSRFIDLVGYENNGAHNQTKILDIGVTRTYNASFSTLTLEMGSGSYEVVAKGLSVGPE